MSLKLEVGEFYLSANLNFVKIINYKPHSDYFVSNIDIYHKDNGIVIDGFNNDYDLIAHIPKELHYRLCTIVKDYHTDNDVKDFIDVGYSYAHN